VFEWAAVSVSHQVVDEPRGLAYFPKGIGSLSRYTGSLNNVSIGCAGFDQSHANITAQIELAH
jgi:hypothetical protein